MEKIKIKRNGIMLVLSSPSGAGKSSVAKMLVKKTFNLSMSVSVTTRLKRKNEIHGKDYFFVSKKEFDNRKKIGLFLESAKVFDHSYGTPKEFVNKNISNGKDLIFDIDWQGAKQLFKTSKENMVSIFILPPSIKELEKRLNLRNLDTSNEVLSRMSLASQEISHYKDYDYVVINSNLENTVNHVNFILNAERLKRSRQIGLKSFVSSYQF